MRYFYWVLIVCFYVAPQGVFARDALDIVLSQATAWIANDQSIQDERVLVRRPDQRARITLCQDELQFRWPFRNNTRTLEAKCETPAWRYFLRVEIDKGSVIVVASHDLNEGDVLTRENLALARHFENEKAFVKEIDDVVGATITQSIERGSPVTQSMISRPSAQFITTKAYAAGETIQLDDVLMQSVNSGDVSDLTVWPTPPVVTSRAIGPGATLSTEDIEPGEPVVIAAQNILRNQVITDEMITLTIKPASQIRGQPVTDLRQAKGFESVRTLKIGSPIFASDLREAELIREGENVTLTIQRGALSITVDTVAMEDAKLGEQVILTNIESGRQIRGIVTGRNNARGLASE